MAVIRATAATSFGVAGGAALASLVQPAASSGFAVSGSAVLRKDWSASARTDFGVYGVVQNAVTPSKLKAESQKAVTEPLISLYVLDLARYNSGVLRFTPQLGRDGKPLSFGGETYFPHPVEVDGFARNAQGQFARPRMRVSNLNVAFTALIISGKDLVGCEMTRIRTFARFLDDGDQPDPNQHFPLEIYRIERKTAHTNAYVEWELASAIDVEGSLLPRRQIIRQYCDYTYRQWDAVSGEWYWPGRGPKCPYTGAAMFTKVGEATDAPMADACGKRLQQCKMRFGDNAELPFRGFPGADQVR